MACCVGVLLGISQLWGSSLGDVGHSTRFILQAPVLPPQPKPDRYVAELTDGVKVEFVGLAPMKESTHNWWLPDGRPLATDPQVELPLLSILTGDKPNESRRVVLNISGVGENAAVTSNMFASRKVGKSPSGQPFVSQSGVVEFGPDKLVTSIEVGVTTQPRSPVRILDAQGKKLPRPTDAAADHIEEDLEILTVGHPRLREPGESRGNGQPLPLTAEQKLENDRRLKQTEITFRTPLSAKEIDLYLVLIDTEGKTHESHQNARYFDTPERTSFVFEVPIDHLAGFRYQMRAYRYWATFDNVSLQPNQLTDVKVTTRATPPMKIQPEPVPAPVVKQPRLSDELRLELKREAAHDARWFFVDLDRARLSKPPFRVDLSHTNFPFQVLSPTETQLKTWLTENRIDLILYIEPKPFDDGSGRWHEIIETRSIRTRLGQVNGLLETPHVEGQAWRLKDRLADIIAPFARKDEATQVSMYAGSSSGFSIKPDSPDLRAFRTAENVVGCYLLEHNDYTKDEVTLRIRHASNVTTSLADLSFEGQFVDGKNGAADPPARDDAPQLENKPNARAEEKKDLIRDSKPSEPGTSNSLKPIEGEVIDAVTGQPIVGATVRFRFRKARLALDAPNDRSVERIYRDVGRITFEFPDDLDLSEHYFVERVTEHPDYLPQRGSGLTLRDILKGESQVARDFIRKVRLSPGAVVSGQILDLKGGPATGVSVSADRERRNWYAPFPYTTTTGVDGRYRLVIPTNLSGGRIYVEPKHAAAVSRAISNNFGEQSVFQLRNGTRLHGRVVDKDQRGVAGVTVRADGGSRIPWRYAITDVEGYYSIPPCQYGTYIIELFEERHHSESGLRGVRIPAAYLAHKFKLPKSAPMEQTVDFRPVESVRLTARYISSDGMPVVGSPLPLYGAKDGIRWYGTLYDVPGKAGLYEAEVPRGMQQLRIEPDTGPSGYFLRITRSVGKSEGDRANWFARLDQDDDSLRIQKIKAATLIVRQFIDGNPIEQGLHTNWPKFAAPDAARQLGLGEPVSGGIGRFADGSQQMYLQPDIDIQIDFAGPEFEPHTETIRLKEGERRTIEVQLHSRKAKADRVPETNQQD